MKTQRTTPAKTPAKTAAPAKIGNHGASHLPAVDVLAYNAELKERDGEGFVGDRASNKAFRAILDELREKLRGVGADDPLGEKASTDISKKALDKILVSGEPEAAGVVHGAIEGYASELARVATRFLRMKEWKGVGRIAVGGGLRGSRVGELAIGRAAVMMKESGLAVDLVPIRHHPDHAGLVGTIHLAPSWVFSSFDGVLAIDIGGSNIRSGIVALGSKKATQFAEAEVARSVLWRYADEETAPKREDIVEHIVESLDDLVRHAKKQSMALAPFIGIGCPGAIEADGSITAGAQNLPGNWESSRFNLPAELAERMPRIDDHDTQIVMHNDAVIQGLSQLPFMLDLERWAVLTIGTGLGNAAFSIRAYTEQDGHDERTSEVRKRSKNGK